MGTEVQVIRNPVERLALLFAGLARIFNDPAVLDSTAKAWDAFTTAAEREAPAINAYFDGRIAISASVTPPTQAEEVGSHDD